MATGDDIPARTVARVRACLKRSGLVAVGERVTDQQPAVDEAVDEPMGGGERQAGPRRGLGDGGAALGRHHHLQHRHGSVQGLHVRYQWFRISRAT